jgi:TetR/AcrR family transcriptional repressor of bet genes
MTAPKQKLTRADQKKHTRRKLIEATMEVIAVQGFSGVTMAAVAEQAGLSRGIGNFHFKSKDQLLLEVLHLIYFEFDAAWKRAIVEAGSSPAHQITAMIRTVLTPPIAAPKRLAVWLAFWGETPTRETYLRICTIHDKAWVKAVEHILTQMADRSFHSRGMAMNRIAESLTALIDGFWVNVLLYSDRHTSENAINACMAFLTSFFPQLSDTVDPSI